MLLIFILCSFSRAFTPGYKPCARVREEVSFYHSSFSCQTAQESNLTEMVSLVKMQEGQFFTDRFFFVRGFGELI